MSAIAELAVDRVVEGRTRWRARNGGGRRAALRTSRSKLRDSSGRIDARVWKDVELLDARFSEGDAVRLLGRVERFRDRLQVDVRSLEAADEVDPAALVPAMRRDADELDGFIDFLAAEVTHPGLRAACDRLLSDTQIRALLRRLPASEAHHSYAGGLLEHTVGVATLARETTQLHGRLRADLLLAAALLDDLGRTRDSAPGRASRRPTRAGCSATCTWACDSSRSGRAELDTGVRAELLHAIACHHDARAARTAEASVLYHANQLDAVAATRPVGD